MCGACDARDDVFFVARFVTGTRAGMSHGVAGPRTRGCEEEDDLQNKNRSKTINTCSFRASHNYTWRVDKSLLPR